MRKLTLIAMALFVLILPANAKADIKPPLVEWGADYGSVLATVAKDGMVWGEDIELSDDNDIQIMSFDFQGINMEYGMFCFDETGHLNIFTAYGFMSSSSLSDLYDEIDGYGTLQENSKGSFGDEEFTLYWKDEKGSLMSLNQFPGIGALNMVTLTMSK